jgi:hypothetical protein
MRAVPRLQAALLLFVLLWVFLPLVRGTETLFLRDVFNAHLEMKWAQAEAMRDGYLPLIDVYRAGGQPLVGNLNAVPLYPDNLLYLVAPFFWAFNAHFWLHVLLAPFAMAWLGRAWRLSPRAAWAAGVCYGLSGFFLSNLAFYNLIAGATLAPALVAACLRLAEEPPGSRRAWRAAAAALVWTLLLLAGDPLTALLSAVLAATALAVRHGRRLAPWGPVALALACGTLLAAPQLVEFLRIVPLSTRVHWGYTSEVTTVASWDPRQLAEWLVPFFFGRPDRLGLGAFWGRYVYTGWQPYYYALYPGLLALCLLAAAGRARGRRAAWWAWGCAGLGVFLALGRFNPLVKPLFGLPGAGAFRYPIKFWLLVAVAAGVLCGIGFERVFEAGRRGLFRGAMAVLFTLLAAFWTTLSFLPQPARALTDLLLPTRYGEGFAANERTRWAGLCLLSMLVLAAILLACGLWRRRPGAAGGAALLVHAAAQLFFLAPLAARDAVLPYRVPPALLAVVPPGSYASHASFLDLFGRWQDKARLPEQLNRWVERRAFAELYPLAGPLWGIRYQLNTSPEGLDAFMTRMARGTIKQSRDPERARLLAAWGVEYLILNRELDAGAAAEARLVHRGPSFGQEVFVYALEQRAPRVFFAGEVHLAPTMTHAFRRLAAAGFDRQRATVVRGEGPPRRGAGGTARVVRETRESFEIEVDARSPGVLVVQRASLPLYRATVDGRPAELTVANLYRLGLELPPGRHRVRIWIDRRPLRMSLAGPLAAVLALLAFGRRDRRRRASTPPLTASAAGAAGTGTEAAASPERSTSPERSAAPA